MSRVVARARLRLLIGAMVAVAAGSGLLRAEGVRVLFDPHDPGVGPFPSDALTVVAPANGSGLRVNLPLSECEDEPSSCAEIEEINKLDGFSPYPRTGVRFSAPVDLHSAEYGIYFVWLDRVGADGGLYPPGHTTQINELVWDPASHTAYFKPNEVFDQRRRLLLVVSDEVRDGQGDPVERDPALDDCLIARASEYCADLSEAVNALDEPESIVGAALFTTLSATEWLEAARDQLSETPPHFRRLPEPNVFIVGSLRSITIRRETGPDRFSERVVTLPGLAFTNLGRVALGEFDSPNYLDDQQAITGSAKGEGPVTLGTNTIGFHVFLPRTAPPPEGYPVVVISHGLGDNRLEGPTLIANGLAAEGFATAAINSVGHGGGPNGFVELDPLFAAAVDVPLAGRGLDLNGDGEIEDDEGCIITHPVPSGLRDCMRQTVVDLMQLVRMIRSGIDLDGRGGLPLDGNRIYFVGQSLGAMTGTMLHAVDPNIRVAALNVGGATAVNVMRRSETFRDIAVDVLAEHEPPLLNQGSDFDDDYTLRNLPPHVVTLPGALEIQTVFERAEWMQMPGDPIAYAPYLRRAPLPGVAAKSTLFQIAQGDRTIRNTENTLLVRTAGGEESTQVYLADTAREAIEELPENPHSYLAVEDVLGPAGRVAFAAQSQIGAYFAAEGEFITDINPLIADLFETEIFVAPVVLPDHLGGDDELTAVSAASYLGPELAADSIATAWATNLASDTEMNDRLPLPTSLAGSTTRIIDSGGRIHFGGLFLVSPMQANLWIPPGVALGPAEIVGSSGDGVISRGTAIVSETAPGFFTANASGEGVPAALLLRFRGVDQTAQELVFDPTSPLGERQPLLMDFGDEDESVFLALFGTGMRAGLEVRATIDGEEVPVSAVAATGEFVGLDQVNVGPIPRTLIGQGVVELRISIDGKSANVVLIRL